MNTNQPTARTLDQFYTSPTVARDCIAFAMAQLTHLNFDTLLEPSAGAGAFSDQLGQACLALDIAPCKPGIVQTDFLIWTPPVNLGRTLVIGNLPFGRVARTAIKFFNKAAEFADAIAFIVPLSFRKESIQRQLDLRFHLLSELELPDQSFVFKGAPYSVPCSFQIWERRGEARLLTPKTTTHADFTFCTRDQAEFALQRVGANAGHIKPVAKAGSANSHYFLRAKGDATLLRERFGKIDFDTVRGNSAGCPSISKTEVVDLYSQILADEEGAPAGPTSSPVGGRHPIKANAPATAMPTPRWNPTLQSELAQQVSLLCIAQASDLVKPLPIDTENLLPRPTAGGTRSGGKRAVIGKKSTLMDR